MLGEDRSTEMQALGAACGALGIAWRAIRAAFAFFARRKCFSDLLSPFLRLIANRPILSGAIMLGLYILWLPLGALCAFIARFTTTPVMTVLLVVGVVALGRLLARTMVFPGCVSAISKGMEREVASRMRSRLSVAIFHVSFALQDLLDLLSNPSSCPRPPSAENKQMRPVAIWERTFETWANYTATFTDACDVLDYMEQNQQLSLHAAVFHFYLRVTTSLSHALLTSLSAQFRASGVASTATSETAGRTLHALLQVPHAPSASASATASAHGNAMEFGSGAAGTRVGAAGVQTHQLGSRGMVVPHILEAHPALPGASADQCIDQVLAAGFTHAHLAAVVAALCKVLRQLSPWIELVPRPGDWHGLKELGKIARCPRADVVYYARKYNAGWREQLRQRLYGAPVVPVAPAVLPPTYASQCADAGQVNALRALGIQDWHWGAFADLRADLREELLLGGGFNTSLEDDIDIDDLTRESDPEAASGDSSAHGGSAHGGNSSTDGHVEGGRGGTLLGRMQSLARSVGTMVSHATETVSGMCHSYLWARTFPSPICGLDYMRAELMLRWRGRHIWMRGAGGNVIDAVYIQSKVRWPADPGAAPLALGEVDDFANLPQGGVVGRHARWRESLQRCGIPPWLLPCFSDGDELPRRGCMATMPQQASATGTASQANSSNSCDGSGTGGKGGAGAHDSRTSSSSTTSQYFDADSSTSSRISSGQSFATSAPASAAARALNACAADVRQPIFGSAYRAADLQAFAAAAPAVVLLCNPNAGFYEFAHRQSEWLDMYSRLGCDIVMYNYRGYGRSSGSPSPSALAADGETIATFLKQELGVARLIAHGESIGGVAACHLAGKGHLAMLIADRNFDTLPKTAGALVAPIASVGLKLVTRWLGSNAASYVAAPGTCCKVLCVDPADQVIRWPSALAAGIAEAVSDDHGTQRGPRTLLTRTISAFSSVLHSRPQVSIAEAQLCSLAGDLQFLCLGIALNIRSVVTGDSMRAYALENAPFSAPLRTTDRYFPKAATATTSVTGTSNNNALGTGGGGVNTATASEVVAGSGSGSGSDPCVHLSDRTRWSGVWVPQASTDTTTRTLHQLGIDLTPHPLLRATAHRVLRARSLEDDLSVPTLIVALATRICRTQEYLNASSFAPSSPAATVPVSQPTSTTPHAHAHAHTHTHTQSHLHPASSPMRRAEAVANSLPSAASSVATVLAEAVEASSTLSPLPPGGTDSPRASLSVGPSAETVSRLRRYPTSTGEGGGVTDPAASAFLPSARSLKAAEVDSRSFPILSRWAITMMPSQQLPPQQAAQLAILTILCGVTNGLGQRLGDEVSGGDTSRVAHFLRCGNTWGWTFEAGEEAGILFDEAMHVGAPAAASTSNNASDTSSAGSGQAEEGSAERTARIRMTAAPSRRPRYLHELHENGLEVARRRLAAFTLDDHNDVETKDILALAQRVLGRVQAWFHAHNPTRVHPTTAGGKISLLRAAMQSKAGMLVPLTCGHNAPWGELEKQVICSAVAAALWTDGGASGARATTVASAT